MNLFLTLVSFNLMIIIHEMGHFLVAKFFKVKVQEFSLFVGPKIFSKKIGETVYSLRTIPIVAYVKMEGEEEKSDSVDSYNNKPIWQRALIIFAGPFANILTAVMAIAIVFLVTGVNTTKISKIESISPAYEAGIREGDYILEYDGKSTYSPVDVMTYSFVKKGKSVDVKYERDGKEYTTILHSKSDFKPYILGATFEVSSTKITEVKEGLPAKLAGLTKGDEITSINGIAVRTIDELRNIIAKSNGAPLKIAYNRDGVEQPKMDITAIPDPSVSEIYLGFYFENEKLDFFETLKHAVLFGYSNVKNVGYTVRWLFTREVKVTQLMGPVGIVASINEAVSQSVSFKEIILNLLGTFALISVAIGATNLVPFPALDGSKLVLLFVEAIRRKPIPVEKEAAISMAGLSILLVFAVFVTYSDISRVMGGFFTRP